MRSSTSSSSSRVRDPSHTAATGTGISAASHPSSSQRTTLASKYTTSHDTSISSTSSNVAPSASAFPAPSLASNDLAQQMSEWVKHMMPPSDPSANHASTSTPAPRDLLPLMRGPMLSIVPYLTSHVVPSSEAKLVRANLKLQQVQQGKDSLPRGPRAAKIAALRAQRALLKQELESKAQVVSTLENQVADLQLGLSSENDAVVTLQDKQRVQQSKAALLQAFLYERRQLTNEWNEYLERIRRQSLLEFDASAAAAASSHRQHEKGLLTNSARSLRNALQILHNSFQETLEASYEAFGRPNTNNNGQQQAGADETSPFVKLTPEIVEEKQEFAQLYSMESKTPSHPSAHSSSSFFNPVTFFGDLTGEVKRSMDEIDAAIRQVEEENRTEKSRQAEFQQNGGVASAPAANDIPSVNPDVSIQESLSSLIQNLQDESTMRFIQAQKLSNETEAQSLLLEELVQKQRGEDALILDAVIGSTSSALNKESFLSRSVGVVPTKEELQATKASIQSAAAPAAATSLTNDNTNLTLLHTSTVTFEQKQLLLSLRRLQNLQLGLAALKAQINFASKTYKNYSTIRDQRQSAMDEYISKKTQLDSFSDARKRNESIMIELVLQHKSLCKKMAEYASRNSTLVQTSLQPLCKLIQETSRELLHGISNEVTQSLNCIQAPMSLLEKCIKNGGSGLVPTSRLALSQIQTPSLQSNQLHALILDPFGSNGLIGNTASTFKGLRGVKLYRMPTTITLYMMELLTKTTFLSAMQLQAQQNHHQIRQQAASASSASSPMSASASALDPLPGDFDVLSTDEWRELQTRLSSLRQLQRSEWTGVLRGVLSESNEVLKQRFPRVKELLNSFWQQPAQHLVPHLRNQHGWNIDEYVEHIRTMLTQIQQQEIRYNRQLHVRAQQQQQPHQF